MATTDENEVYTECLKAGSQGLTYRDYMDTHPGAEVGDIVMALNSLLSKGMVELFHVRNELIYKAIKKEDAGKAGGLSGEEHVVYSTIRASGNEGIWTKHLKSKTNLHETVIKRCLKVLEQKALVKGVKSVKYPTRKLYMLMELTPSEEVTGGPWFTDNELDHDFVEQLAGACYKFIVAKSFPKGSSSVYTTAHNSYPSATAVRKHIMDRRISAVDLTVADITMLLDVLVYDGKVEKFIAQVDEDWDDEMDTASDWVYKAIRGKKAESAWQDCPCGVCPVADFCTETGPVNPAGCTYYNKWLEF
ncbi:34-kDa subunit of RNA polymerase III (C) [Gryganskiella cystojenkinii]|nr:34-kDa subunit of RNA polymerase III (C) [Gryganskiella cystojenkinii]